MKLEHTPGPWIVAPHNFGEDISICTEKDSKYYGSTIYQSDWIAELCPDNTDGGADRAEENARLIAAAPEMLEALIDACRTIQWEKGVKAIEKATGKTWEKTKEEEG